MKTSSTISAVPGARGASNARNAPGAPKELLLEAKSLNAWYGAAQILYDVDLDVRRGEVVALMGRNGAGKSTTLKTLIGMLPKRRGEVRFMGHDI